MATLKLLYIYDPLCGWCYGAAPLIAAAAALPGVELHLHGGGMMTGAQRQPVSEGLRNYVMVHDQRIATLTGQPFGVDYTAGLLRDQGAALDSAPPTTAILATEHWGKGLAMLHRIQRAHYVEGRRVADAAVLKELAADVGLPQEEFATRFAAINAMQLSEHFTTSRRLLKQVGGQGFPTLVQQQDEQLTVLPLAPYFGKVDAWRKALSQHLAA